MSDGSTTGVWIPGDSDLQERFDARYGNHQRSREIRNAMELMLEIDSVLGDLDFDLSDDPKARERERRHFVRQALINELQRDE